MSITLTHAGLPDGLGRFDLLSLFEKVAHSQYGLSRTAIALVRHYILRTTDEDFLKGRICAVWTQVCRTAQALDLTPRSINSAERELEAAGFLIRSTGANGARAGERRDGSIVWAAGINLAPLIERLRELQDRAEAIRLHRRTIDQCRAEIRQINRAIRDSEQTDLQTMASEILPRGRTSRINDLEQLQAIRAALTAVLDTLAPASGAQKTSDASEENCAPNIPPEESSKPCSPSSPSAAPELRATPRLAVALATDEYHGLLRSNGGTNWPAIVETSWQVAMQLGISQRTWQEACTRFGREQAALCVIVIQRNAMLDVGDRYHVRRPQGCLAGMIRSSLTGAMNLRGLVAAVLDREDR